MGGIPVLPGLWLSGRTKQFLNCGEEAPLLFQLCSLLVMLALPSLRQLTTAAPTWTEINTASASLQTNNAFQVLVIFDLLLQKLRWNPLQSRVMGKPIYPLLSDVTQQ